ncbi:MAG: putative lipoprotein [Ignavibacteria bacterium]|nr:putative lipoprotein [Ignavibacteria bacterium]
MNRRQFISRMALLPLTPGIMHFTNTSLLAQITKENKPSFDTTKFVQIIEKSKREIWINLEIGALVGKIATEFIGTPYQAGTLDPPEPEKCRIFLNGLDCVTLFENSLCIARCIKKYKTKFSDLIDEVTFTRYRSGLLTDYSSRLHYTADWIYDNEQKNVVKNITSDIGGEPLVIYVSYMSANWNKYEALKRDKSQIEKIAAIERQINDRKHYYIPRNQLAEVEKFIKTGDIIAIATNTKGLDYSHTGLAIKSADGSARFLHASSKKKQVVLAQSINDYVHSFKTNIGITVSRPLNVTKRG